MTTLDLRRTLKRRIGPVADRIALSLATRRDADFGRLAPIASIDLRAIMADPLAGENWRSRSPVLAGLFAPAKGSVSPPGAINLGDRRALFQLIRVLKPARVLEIGTHLGASTLAIAEALRLNHEADGVPGGLVTVDIADVNQSMAAPWRGGLARSPADSVDAIGMSERVRFVVDRSEHFLKVDDRDYDLIFLDGSHAATSVYRDLTLAPSRLSEGGVILLHDYFPDARSLWADGHVMAGPWLAVRRLILEGAPITALPFGSLPWVTKKGSHVTSLALLAHS